METKTILVTGASRGIGLSIAEMLEARGNMVVRHASRCGPDGIVGADLREVTAPQVLWDQALDQANGQTNGTLDVLINNAGFFSPCPLDSSDIVWLDAWEETLRINLSAAAQLSRLAIRHWLDRGQAGRIVHIASRAAYRGDSPDHWHYAAAKGGLVALHKTIARHYASDQIMSYCICPGFTDTDIAGDYLASRGGPGLLADIPLGRVATPTEIARIATFCALDAPESMTGAVLDANGASYVR